MLAVLFMLTYFVPAWLHIIRTDVKARRMSSVQISPWLCYAKKYVYSHLLMYACIFQSQIVCVDLVP